MCAGAHRNRNFSALENPTFLYGRRANYCFSYLQRACFSLWSPMSRALRPPSEAGVQTWEAEDDDMAEGDLGYGLGRRPGGIYEVQVSHLFTSRKRSDETTFSPPPFPRKGEERSGATFQHSWPQDHHRRHSSIGKDAASPHPSPLRTVVSRVHFRNVSLFAS